MTRTICDSHTVNYRPNRPTANRPEGDGDCNLAVAYCIRCPIEGLSLLTVPCTASDHQAKGESDV